MQKFSPLVLNGPVSEKFHLTADDAKNANRVFNEIGLLEFRDQNAQAIRTPALIDAIKRYQKMRRLRVDGKLSPGGETEQDLNRTLGEIRTAAKSPTFKCKVCKGPHGGAFGEYCWWCWMKLFG